ncbi:hypothetical protein C8F04DRAFT_1266868 [Mycena alexandri]|uniref:Uncharacterized protein n=1 Tax=Mycena alexandri TaxID=1745969 RepID=A0AAD6SK60_9AGAR|nr:hypothetical protein C8F04DRAFT_1266868 [Mycena alexandri]
MAQDNNPLPPQWRHPAAAAERPRPPASSINVSTLTFYRFCTSDSIPSATLLSPLSMADLGVTFSDAANAAGACAAGACKRSLGLCDGRAAASGSRDSVPGNRPATASSAAAHMVPGSLAPLTRSPTAPLTPIPDHGEKWFAISVALCRPDQQRRGVPRRVSGVSTALTGKHATQTIALQHFNAALASGAVAVI